MKPYQFWILLLISLVVSVLLVKQIFLSRELTRAQATLVDSQEVASTGPSFENAWQKLAMGIFQAGPQDPALLDILKKENIGIKMKTSPAPASMPATTPAPPPIPAKSSTP